MHFLCGLVHGQIDGGVEATESQVKFLQYFFPMCQNDENVIKKSQVQEEGVNS